MSEKEKDPCARHTVCCDKQDTGEIGFALEPGATTFTSGREFSTCGDVSSMYSSIKTARENRKNKAKKVKA